MDGRVAGGVVCRRLTAGSTMERRVLSGGVCILSPCCRPLLRVLLRVLRMLLRGPRPLGRATSRCLVVATAGVGRVVRCPIPCWGNGTLYGRPVSCWGMPMYCLRYMPAKNPGCGSIPCHCQRRGVAMRSCAVACCCMQGCDRRCSCGMGEHDPGRWRAVAGCGTSWGLLWC